MAKQDVDSKDNGIEDQAGLKWEAKLRDWRMQTKERGERGKRSGRKQREKMAYWGSDTENGVCQNKENIIHNNKVLKNTLI